MSNKIIDIPSLQRFYDNLKSYITEMMSKKQDTLLSGENIKTINGESILGDGDININKHIEEAIQNSITKLLNTPV